jgi:hypothetical protein
MNIDRLLTFQEEVCALQLLLLLLLLLLLIIIIIITCKCKVLVSVVKACRGSGGLLPFVLNLGLNEDKLLASRFGHFTA